MGKSELKDLATFGLFCAFKWCLKYLNTYYDVSNGHLMQMFLKYSIRASNVVAHRVLSFEAKISIFVKRVDSR
jgi:hypothetical protein